MQAIDDGELPEVCGRGVRARHAAHARQSAHRHAVHRLHRAAHLGKDQDQSGYTFPPKNQIEREKWLF